MRGFRQMPGGAPNPGQSAGVQFGDLLDAVQGERLGSFQEAVGRLKGLSGTVTLTLIRAREMRPPALARPCQCAARAGRAARTRGEQQAWPVAGLARREHPERPCKNHSSRPRHVGAPHRQMSRLPATEPAGPYP